MDGKAEQPENADVSTDSGSTRKRGNVKFLGIDRADTGPTGDGDGASVGGSDGSDGDGGVGGIDGGDGSGDSGLGGVEIVGDGGPVAEPEPAGGSSDGIGDGTVKRGRGRPRGSVKRGSGASRATGGGAGSGDKRSGIGSIFDSVDTGQDPPSSIGPAPKKVDANEVGGGDDYKAFTKTEAQRLLAGVLDAIFKAVGHLTKGEHWPLEAKEAADLAKAILDVSETLPKKQSQRLQKLMKEYAPYISLITVAGAIIYPRVAYAYLERDRAANPDNYYPGGSAEDGAGASGAGSNQGGGGLGSRAGRSRTPNDAETYFAHIFEADRWNH